MIQYVLSYRCIMDPTTVCLDGFPRLQTGEAFLYALLQAASCFNDRNPSPQALIPGAPTRILIRLYWQSFPLLTCNRASLLARWNCTLS